MICHLDRRDRMVDPFVIVVVDIAQGAKRAHVVDMFRALVHQGTLLARKRHLVGIGLDEILAHLRADGFQPVTKIGQQRIVATQRAGALEHVERAQQGQRSEDADAPPRTGKQRRQRQHAEGQQDAEDVGEIAGHGNSFALVAVVPGVGIEPT